ncbi:MAG TPA: winged helix-turn-helix domain-containing protein [Pyrinomonadaceae bacterium]|nr:winged helix-turn-helix domain-containing protein [Pyrinomonadaceae bacterium]
MASHTSNIYAFGEFRLLPAENILENGGNPVSLKPKAFSTLVYLVENHGRLVEKSELLEQVWGGSFVEEASVSKCIWEIRAALSDDTKGSRFIQTVPKHGYRFIGDVNISNGDEQSSGDGLDETLNLPESSAALGDLQPNASGVSDWQNSGGRLKRRSIWLLTAAAAFAVALLGGGVWFALRLGTTTAPSASAQPTFEKLSIDGKVGTAAISPDGKTVIFADDAGESGSLWLRNLELATNIQIIPPAAYTYYEIEIAPDGKQVYFVRNERKPQNSRQGDIFRMPMYGGVPVKVISEVQGNISLAADGSRLSFVRCAFRNDDYCSLWTADSDGANEKRLVSRTGKGRISGNQISPDGKKVAFASGQSNNWANEFGLSEVDIESGVEREVTKEKFFNIRAVTWLPDQQGLLVTAKRYPDNTFRIWHISAVSGKAEALTTDSEDYLKLSLSSDASLMVATKVREDFHLNLYRTDSSDPAPFVLTEASTVAFAPDGKLIYSSKMSGNDDLWTINIDGSNRRQLTNDPGLDLNGIFSPDGRSIFFTSNRTGDAQVWRMNPDGSDQTQITRDNGGYPQFVSPDQKWVYYTEPKQRSLLRVPTVGGEPETVLAKTGLFVAFSADGSRAAFAGRSEKGRQIFVVSLPSGQTEGTFDLPNQNLNILHPVWAADGKSLYYVWPDDTAEKHILWQQALSGGMPSRVADLGRDGLRESTALAISPDGKIFAAVQGNWRHDAVLIRDLR